MKLRLGHMWWAIAGIVLLGGALSGTIVSNVEQPKYQTVIAEKNIEIRDYAPMVVAEVDQQLRRH